MVQISFRYLIYYFIILHRVRIQPINEEEIVDSFFKCLSNHKFLYTIHYLPTFIYLGEHWYNLLHSWKSNNLNMPFDKWSKLDITRPRQCFFCCCVNHVDEYCFMPKLRLLDMLILFFYSFSSCTVILKSYHSNEK